jgi:hypothetical protein
MEEWRKILRLMRKVQEFDNSAKPRKDAWKAEPITPCVAGPALEAR